MKAIRAFGMKLALPKRPVLTETELPDLTTAAQRESNTVPMDALHVAPPRALWTPLPSKVPGTLVTGTLPDDHHARFLLRVPRDWNGRLVVAATSGVTDENTYDLYFSDFLLSRGCAFGVTDKGVRRVMLDGDTVLMPIIPEASIARWKDRLEALAVLGREQCARLRGRAPERVYAVGLSNGGYVARRAAESHAGLIDGAVEISGVLWRADAGNLLRELPRALRGEAVFPPAEGRWAPLAAFYRQMYWEAVLQMFLEDLDPSYDGPLTEYDLDRRPHAVIERLRAFENTGDLQVPLISIAGRRDYLIGAEGHALAYRDLIRARGKHDLHSLVLVDYASHIDTNAEQFAFVEPLMPRAHAAFEELVARVEREPAATGPSSPRPR